MTFLKNLLLYVPFSMDDPALFQAFLTNIAQIATPRVRNTIIAYIDTFSALLSINDEELTQFVATTHSANRRGATNRMACG